jgi:hypothetical protein
LHFSEPLNFPFTLFSLAGLGCSKLCLLSVSAFLELDDFLLKGFLPFAGFILCCDSSFVANFRLLLETLDSFLLGDQIL